MMAYYYEVRTPPYIFAFTEKEIEEAEKHLKYPMIVKHYNGYNSIGMTPKSKVSNREELWEMATKMISEFEGNLLGLSFITCENMKVDAQMIVSQVLKFRCTLSSKSLYTF